MDSLILALLMPFATAIGLALLNGFPRLERGLAAVASVALAGWSYWLLRFVDTHGTQVSMVGGYAAPYGIALVADRLACIMLCLSTTVGAVALAYSFATVTVTQQRYFFYPLFFVLILGVNWAFVTGDLFNLFVAYEVMLIGSYGAMLSGASRGQVQQSLAYIAINLVGGALFVVGIGLVYVVVGTVNLADLAERTAGLSGERAALMTAVSMVLLVVFALKAGAFPLFFWLPDAYPEVPAGVNGYFAGLLTKVGVYSLLRVSVMTFRQPGHELVNDILLVLSGFTMLGGVLGAICQWEMRRILSWHIISQVGYMVMGIGLAADAGIAPAAIAATVFYVVHHIIVKASLFLVAGIAERVAGTSQLKEMGGAHEASPFAALLFLVAALSLAGMPPFSGFPSKLVLMQVGLAGGHTVIVAVAVLTSFLTLASMLKIWSYAFWRAPVRASVPQPWGFMAAPTAVLVAGTIVLGLWAEPCLRLARDTAIDIASPAAYVAAVLHRGTGAGS